MTARRRFTDEERRSRLIARHLLGGGAGGVLDAVRSLVTLHSTDPATPYLSLRARVAGFEPRHLDRALLNERSLWRLHAMRRTLFVVPADEGVTFLAGTARSVAAQERKRLLGWLGVEVGGETSERLLARLEQTVADLLADGGERSTQELMRAAPDLAMGVTLGSGRWTARSPVGPRVLLLMAMEGKIVRTRAAGSWRSSQYRWAATGPWFGTPAEPPDEEAARAAIAFRYLEAHGPATLDDLRWWTGWSAAVCRRALSALRLEEVELEDGSTGFLIADDAAEFGPSNPAMIAFLPALDSTPMGWRGREWYLGPHAPQLFDRNGNVGPTIWSGGRVVGLWTQRADGAVVTRLLEDTGGEVGALIAREAAVVQDWLAGVIVKPRFRTPAEKALAARE